MTEKLSSAALAMARDFDRLMLIKKKKMPADSFQHEALELLATYIRPEIFRLAIAMEVKLAEKDAERGDSWKELPAEDAADRILDEQDELAEAIYGKATAETVWSEAGDVGNFAMFSAINYETEKAKEQE